MKKVLAMGLGLMIIVSFVAVAIAADEMYSLKGPVISVDSGAKTVTVHSVEGVKVAADNRWKGDVTFATNDMTKISMDKKTKTFNDLKAGQNVKVKFNEKDGKSTAVEIMIMSDKKAQ